jgi:hypothetical protein
MTKAWTIGEFYSILIVSSTMARRQQMMKIMQWFSDGVILPPENIWHFFSWLLQQGETVVTDHYWFEAWNIAQHSTSYRTAHHNKNIILFKILLVT